MLRMCCRESCRASHSHEFMPGAGSGTGGLLWGPGHTNNTAEIYYALLLLLLLLPVVAAAAAAAEHQNHCYHMWQQQHIHMCAYQ